MRAQLPYPAELGQGWVDRLPIATDMVVYQSVHHFQTAVNGYMLPLAEFKLDFSEPTLTVQALHSGAALSRELEPRADLHLKPGNDLFRHGEHGYFMPLLDTSADIVMTMLMLTDRALADFMGEDAAQQLLQAMDLGQAHQVKVQPIPLHVTEPLRQCMASGSTGTLHALFAQSKILEYLWKLATFAGGTRSFSRATPRELGTLRALHAYLTQLEGEMPTLKALSSKFGESPQTLNKGFLREYGQTIYAMVTNHRLHQAHRALADGRLPIKTIAKRLGYSHVNHFTYAFKMKFGYTPGSLRRRPVEATEPA
jgi:AraC-like DNA-binding protein